MKKIAVASDDGQNLALHFGRTKGFLIFDVENREIKQKKYIENSFTGHAHGHQYEDRGHHHSHEGILRALYDCEIVISHGMGRRLMEDMEKAGKQVFVATAPSAEIAVKEYLEGTLKHNPNRTCQHEKKQY